MSAETAVLQQRVTFEAYPCPDCGQPMVGARVFDPQTQEAFVGAVCVPCDAAFRVVWTDAHDEPEQVVVLTRKTATQAKGPAPDSTRDADPTTKGDGTR